jgi:hypothetical protein
LPDEDVNRLAGGMETMNYSEVIRSQYLASLEMFRETITKCPASIWDDPSDKTKFWHIAYHVLFYTHLYLQESENEFRPWDKHRQDYQHMGPSQPRIKKPFTKEEILAYLEVCKHEVDERTKQLNPDAESGFAWLHFNKLELQFYNIRHLQQHTGELMERLGTRANIDVAWVGKKHDQPQT